MGGCSPVIFNSRAHRSLSLCISDSQVVTEATNKFPHFKRNKAVLILLIVRNVLIETRKTVIHMGLNQSHAPHTVFRRHLLNSCPLTNGCIDSVLLTPEGPTKDNVSSVPCCIRSPLTLVQHLWFNVNSQKQNAQNNKHS